MIIRFLDDKSPEEIIFDVIRYEYLLDSYEELLEKLSPEELFEFHVKCMKYYNIRTVINKEQWVENKIKYHKLEEEYESLKQLLGAPDEDSRKLGLNLAKHTFQFNVGEVCYIMGKHFHFKTIENEREKTLVWELDNRQVRMVKKHSRERARVYLVTNGGNRKTVITEYAKFDDRSYVSRLIHKNIF